MKTIHESLREQIERRIENCDNLDEEPTITVLLGVEGYKEGIGYVVGEFDGTIDITNYTYDRGDYYTPSYEDYDVHYDGILSYSDEDEKEYTETINDNF